MSDSLNFEQLRKEAKTILKLCRAADRNALARMRAQLPRLAALNDEDMANQIKLADIHHALARESGHLTWAALKRHDDPLGRFLAAVRSGSLESAKRELEHAPDLARESIHAACSVGDADAVRYHLDRDSTLLGAEDTGWQPLLYVCGSPLHSLGQRHAFGIRECAEMLLDRGADPNAFSLADPADPESKISAQVRAALSSNRLVFFLLAQRGAAGDVAAVKAAMARGRRVAGSDQPNIGDYLSDPGFREELNRRLAPIRARRAQTVPPKLQMSIKDVLELGRDDDGEMLDTNLILFRLAFERGADPNGRPGPNNETALHSFARMSDSMAKGMTELFIEHGADPNVAAVDGSTPYSIAVREGNAALADLLLAHGARADSASAVDQFIGACRRVDAETAWSILRAHPDILKTLGPEREDLLHNAAISNQVEAVRLMAKLGFDLTTFGNRGATALHHAAWRGHTDMVRLLIEHHAPVNIRDAVYGTSALAWAAHGSASSKNWREAEGDYCAIVESLIDAGASRDAACNKWGVGPEQIGSERVVALLKSRGF